MLQNIKKAIRPNDVAPRFFPQKGIFRFLIVIMTTLALFSVVQGCMGKNGDGTGALSVDSGLQKAGPIKDGTQVVHVGFYVMNVYEMSIPSNSYYMDFYVWFRWKGDINPVEKLDVVNSVEKWGRTITEDYDEIQILPDGSKYQTLRIESRLFQPFDLSRYPIDSQKLNVYLESTLSEETELVFVQDDASFSGIRRELVIPGWDIVSTRVDRLSHTYPTRFGDTRLAEQETRFSVIRLGITIRRPITFFMWKLLLPLLVVVLASLGAMLLHPSHVDARISAPVTALLTAVFLQQTYSSSLPEIGYMVLMDQIYSFTYLLIIAAMVQTIVTANWAAGETEEDFARVKRLDRKYLVFHFSAFIVGVLFLILK